MIKKAFVALLLFLPLLAWEGFETRHFIIYFPPGREGEALKALGYLEKYYHRVSTLTGNPGLKTIVVIQDMGLSSNGFTDPFVPSIHLYTSSPYPSPEFGAMRSWWRQVSIHEFTHAAHLSRAEGTPRLIRWAIGRAFLPNLFLPEFMIEGIAVYSESTLVPFEGRLNEGFYEAYLRSTTPFDLSFLMGEPTVYPFYSMRYIYGGEFTKFLAESHGEESLTRYINTYSSSLIQILGISPGAYKKAFGYGLSHLYKEFSIKNSQSTKLNYLFSSDDILWLGQNNGKLYISALSVKLPFPYFYIPTYKILEYNPKTGKTRKLVSDPVVLPLRFQGKNLYYVRPEAGRGFKNRINQGYGEVREIIELNLETKEKRKVLRGLIKAFAVKGNRLIYSAPMGCCGSKLMLVDLITGKGKTIFASEALEIYDIAWGNKIAVGARKDGEGSDLYLFEKGSLKRITNTPFTETNLRWSSEGLIFSANPEGQWKPYLWDGSNFYNIAETQFCKDPNLLRGEVFCIGLSSGKKVIFKASTEKVLQKWETETASKDVEIPEFRRASLPYNFLSLLIPDLYFLSEDENKNLNLNVFGHDARDENFYLLSAGVDEENNPVASFNLYSFSLSPFIFSLTLETGRETDLILGLSTPAFKSGRKFLRSLYFNIDFGDRLKDARRTSVSLSTDVFFADRTNGFHLYLRPELHIEDEELGSSLNRRGYFLEIGTLFPLSRRSGILLNAYYGFDPENPDGINFNTRSWGTITSTKGLLLYGEASLRLLNIRKGIANPHIFFDGLYTSIFSESFSDAMVSKQSIGAFLSMEVSAYHGLLKIYPMAGAAYRLDEGKWVPVIGISGFLFPVGLGERRNPFKKYFYSGFNKYVKRRWEK